MNEKRMDTVVVYSDITGASGMEMIINRNTVSLTKTSVYLHSTVLLSPHIDIHIRSKLCKDYLVSGTSFEGSLGFVTPDRW